MASLTVCLTWILNVLEFVDTDFDALTVGSSFKQLTAEQEATFAESWSCAPGMNWIALHLGLPGILALHLLLAAAYQLHRFRQETAFARKKADGFPMDVTGAGKRFWFFQTIVMSADCGGLLVLMNAFDGLRECCVPCTKGQRPAGFIAKAVVETVPSAWFQISYLALAYDSMGPSARCSAIFSVITSFLSAFTQLVSMLSHYWRSLTDIRNHSWVTYEKRGGFVIVSVAFSAMLVRMFGIFYCESHIYQVSLLTCMDA